MWLLAMCASDQPLPVPTEDLPLQRLFPHSMQLPVTSGIQSMRKQSKAHKYSVIHCQMESTGMARALTTSKNAARSAGQCASPSCNGSYSNAISLV